MRGFPRRAARHTGFTDHRVERELARNGYAVIPFLDAAELANARAVRASLGPAPGDPCTGFHSDAWSSEASYRRAVADGLGAALATPLARIAPRHHVLGAAHLVKWPGSEGGVAAHRDPNFVDERHARSVTIWCPLDDVTERSGALRVVARSHRGVGTSPRIHDAESNLVPAAEVEPVETVLEMQAGAAVVFDHALVHRSSPNVSGSVRTAAAILLVPAGERPRYALPGPGGSPAVIHIGPDFFIDNRLNDLDVDHLLVTSERVK